MSSARTAILVNPAGGGGRSGRLWPAIEAQLRAALEVEEVVHTQRSNHARTLAPELVQRGASRLVVAGGDGTLSEVVNGLLETQLAQCVQLGVLPLGTGCDLARSLELPTRPSEAIERLRRGGTRWIDAGRIRRRDADGRDRTDFFINATSFGISARVLEKLPHTTRRLGGRVAFLWPSLRAIAQAVPSDVTVAVDGETLHEGPLTLGAVCNGSNFGAGMRIAPQAEFDDAALDCVIVGPLPRRTLLRRLPRLYRGTHLDDPAVTARRGRHFSVHPRRGSVVLEADGELLGPLPAEIEVLPRAIQLFGAGNGARELGA